MPSLPRFRKNTRSAWGCFTNVSQALLNNLAKIPNTGNHIYGENFKLKLCTCAQSMALGTRTKFQLEILIRTTISAIHKFQENILESSRNVSETIPWALNYQYRNYHYKDKTVVRPSYLYNEIHIPGETVFMLTSDDLGSGPYTPFIIYIPYIITAL